MENNYDKSIFEFGIDQEGKSQLAGIAMWTNVNAIIGFVALGVSLISTIIAMGQMSRYSGSAAGGGLIFGIMIQLTISLILNITLIGAASNLKKALALTDQGFFGIGLTKLATYFKIVGILTIIVLVLVVLAFLIALATGFGRS